jgi:hypothetical protein
MPFGVGLTIALVGIALGLLALRRNLLLLPHKRWVVWLLVVVGLGTGFPLGAMASHRDATLQVYGVPLTIAILELHEGRWLDFVGPMTPVGFVLNTLVWAALWQLILVVALHVRSKRAGTVGARP